MRLRIKNTAITLRVFSWLQVIGGITGLWLMTSLMLQTGPINGPILLIVLIGLALFSYSIYCGKRLLTDENKIPAVIHSTINQFLQLFQWSMFGYGLSYSSGAELTLGVQGFEVNFNFAVIVSTFKMAINSNDDFFIKINLISVLVIIVLVDMLNELRGTPENEKDAGLAEQVLDQKSE